MFTKNNTRLSVHELTDDFLRDFFELPKNYEPTKSFFNQKFSIDITDDTLHMALLVPGYGEDNLEIQFADDHIIVKSLENDKFNKVYGELAPNVNETIKIGKDWDGSNAVASASNGILYIYVPKFEERLPKKISFRPKAEDKKAK